MNDKKESYMLLKYFGGKLLLKLNKTKTKIKKVLLFYPSDIIKKFQISKHKFLIYFDVYDEIFKKINKKYITFSVKALVSETRRRENFSELKVQLEEFENENDAKLFFEFIF